MMVYERVEVAGSSILYRREQGKGKGFVYSLGDRGDTVPI